MHLGVRHAAGRTRPRMIFAGFCSDACRNATRPPGGYYGEWTPEMGIGGNTCPARQAACDCGPTCVVWVSDHRDTAVVVVARPAPIIMSDPSSSFVDRAAAFLRDRPAGARAVDVGMAIGQDPRNVGATLRNARRRGLVERRDGLWFPVSSAEPREREYGLGYMQGRGAS